MSMIYEKPAMQFTEIRSSKAVAAPCWSNAANGGGNSPAYYYEVSNADFGGRNTYVGFTISNADGNASCKDMGEVNMRVYFYGDGLDTPEKKAKAVELLNAAYAAEFGAVSNGGSNFQGSTFSATVGNSW